MMESYSADCDLDALLTWEDFFGSENDDLVPSLITIYDNLIARKRTFERSCCDVPSRKEIVTRCGSCAIRSTDLRDNVSESKCRSKTCPAEVMSRPLSDSSIASSTSFGSDLIVKSSSAYLASVESLVEDDDEAMSKERRNNLQTRGERFKTNVSQGSEDSGVGLLHVPGGYDASSSTLSSSSSSSSTSSTSSNPPKRSYPISYTDRVVMEIIDTEAVYVRDLRAITEGYLLHWRNMREDFSLSGKLDELFGNIEDVYLFNRSFLAELHECRLDPVRIARCFVRNNTGFSVYTQYCTNYPRTVSCLTELMRQESTMRLFRERQLALQHTLPLSSYLLKPVQRILKYHLLLRNMVNQWSSSSASSDGEPNSEIIRTALSAMTRIAQNINDMKRKHEHSVRVRQIQSLLCEDWAGAVDLAESAGELCAEGTFRMAGAKAMRHVFLFDKVLVFAKKKHDGLTLAYKDHIYCSNLMLIESVPGEPLSFHVIPFDNPRIQYTLYARTHEQKREWTLQLKRVILENYNAVIPLHARQLLMEQHQQWQENNQRGSNGHYSAPEYLLERRRRRLSKQRSLSSTSAGNNFKSQPSTISEETCSDNPDPEITYDDYDSVNIEEDDDIDEGIYETLKEEENDTDSDYVTLVELNNVKSPTQPSVWLQEQQHLPIPIKKADSLPRSFQVNLENSKEPRPITIASSEPAKYANPEIDEFLFKKDSNSSLVSSFDTSAESVVNIKQEEDGNREKGSFPVNQIYRLNSIRGIFSRFRTDDHLQFEVAKNDRLLLWRSNRPKKQTQISSAFSHQTFICPAKKAAAFLGIQPDSIISLPMSPKPRIRSEPRISPQPNESTPTSPNVVTNDLDNNFYEKSLEVLDEEEPTDDASFSDESETIDFEEDNEETASSDFQRVKSVRERQKELENLASSSSLNCIESKFSDNKPPVGWVKQIVKQLQNN